MDIRQYIKEYWNELWNPDSKAWQYIDRTLFILLPVIVLILPQIPKEWRGVMEILIWVIPLSIWGLFFLLVVPYRLVSKYKRQLKEEADDPLISETVQKLKQLTFTIGNKELDAATILNLIGNRLARGAREPDIMEIICKQYTNSPDGTEALGVTNSVLEQLSLYDIIQSEQRTTSSVRGPQGVTYWKPTDFGKKVIQYLQMMVKLTPDKEGSQTE